MSIEINRDMIEKLQKTDPEALKIAIKAISKAMGASDRQTNMALGNIDMLKRKASRMTEDELREIADKIPPEKVEEIKRILNIK